MEKKQYGFLLIFSIVVSLGLVSFVCCIVAESKKAEIEDLKLDNDLCYLPRSPAFGYGFASIICLVVAQVMANLVICGNYFRSSENMTKKPTIGTTVLLVLSWVSFGLAIILLSAATSMSRTQIYGKGWLDGQCYLVKEGVYTASGVLILIDFTCLIGSAVLNIRRLQIDELRSKATCACGTKMIKLIHQVKTFFIQGVKHKFTMFTGSPIKVTLVDKENILFF